MKVYLFLLLAVCLACEDPVQKAVVHNRDDKREPLIRENRKWAQTEDEIIEAYLERNKLTVNNTGTGLRYKIYEDQPGESIREGQKVKVKYVISLLTGKECYRSEPGNSENFVVGQDNVESGLHEGITYMSPGDKAIFIVPSHLAHGLTGDLDKIPPRSPLVFDIELVGTE